MPLLFDRKDFFHSSSATLTFDNGRQEKMEIDKNFVDNIAGSSHRKLHFLRLLAFAEFYNSPEWQASAKYRLCDPENMHISFTSQKNALKNSLSIMFILNRLTQITDTFPWLVFNSHFSLCRSTDSILYGYFYCFLAGYFHFLNIPHVDWALELHWSAS